MSKHLKYSKDAKIGFEGHFFDDKNMSAAEQTGFVYNVANGYRDRFKPVFANETKYLPNIKGSDLVSSSVKRTDLPANIPSAQINFPSTESLTVPPHKKADEIIKFLVIGGALFLVYQILTD
jgi:hypothetical protein